jgi:Tfp pilus assembly protein FimT
MVELMVTIAILSIIAGLGILMSMEFLKNSFHRSERDVIITLLERARSRAMSNVSQTAWSVCYVTPDYVIAKGAVCDAAHAYDRLPGNAVITNASEFSNPAKFPTIVFTQLTGDVSTSPILTIVEPGQPNRIISINHAGTIIW